MHPDYQSHTHFRTFTPQVNGLDREGGLIELFLYPWGSGKSVVKYVYCTAEYWIKFHIS